MFLAKIDSSQLNSLSVSSTTPSLVQLSAGGSAVLSAPSAPLLSGKLLKLVVTGRAAISSGGSTAIVSLYLGNSTASPVLATSGGISLGTSSGTGALTTNFAMEYDFSWDSVAQQTIASGVSSYPAGTIQTSISSQSALQFTLGSAKNSFGDSNFTLTITEFKLELV